LFGEYADDEQMIVFDYDKRRIETPTQVEVDDVSLTADEVLEWRKRVYGISIEISLHNVLNRISFSHRHRHRHSIA